MFSDRIFGETIYFISEAHKCFSTVAPKNLVFAILNPEQYGKTSLSVR